RTMLKIDNLHASIHGREILKGLSLEVKPGEVHAIMGPNGAGKSTLGNVLSGRSGYDVTAGSVSFEGRDLLAREPEERAADGVFLAFQYPVEIPGVNNTYFLRSALNAQRKARGEPELDSMQFLKKGREKMAMLLVQGLRQEMIARRLKLSAKTVNTHKSRLFEKIGVQDSIALARLAARYGLMDPAQSL